MYMKMYKLVITINLRLHSNNWNGAQLRSIIFAMLHMLIITEEAQDVSYLQQDGMWEMFKAMDWWT